MSRPEAATTQLSASIAFFERRVARDPDNALLSSHLIDRYILRFGRTAELADLDRAELLAERVLPFARHWADAASRLSGLHLMQHEFAEAFSLAEQATRRDPASAAAAGALLEAAIAVGRYEVADRVGETMATRTIGGRVRKALYLDAKGHSEKASALLRRACRRLESQAARDAIVVWCLTQLAGIEHGVRGPGEARAILRHASRVDPGARAVVEGMGDLALADGEYDRAAHLYRSILSAAHPDLLLRLAEAYRGAGNPDGALLAERRFVAFASAPEREPLFGGTLALHLADQHAGGGQHEALERALGIAQRELSRRPTSATFDLMAWIHLLDSRPDSALHWSDRSLTWGSPSRTQMLHRAAIMTDLGHVRQADSLVAAATDRPRLLSAHDRRVLERVTTRRAAQHPGAE